MLRFQSQVEISSIADELVENQWEVLMPSLNIKDFNANICGCSNTFMSSISSVLGLEKYTPIVEQINFRPQSFKNTAQRVRTGWINLPEDKENYDIVTITMFCSAGMLTQYYLDAWKSMMFNEEGEFFYPSYMYKKNIEIYIYGPGNIQLEQASAVAHFTLQGAYPFSQEPYKFTYTNNPKRVRITASFRIDKIVWDKNLANSSIIQELLTSPTSLVDKAITTVFGRGNQQYSIDEVYT